MSPVLEEVVVDEVAPPVEAAPIYVNDLDDFISLLANWHKQQVATMEHMQTIPEGTNVAVEGEEPFCLEGDVLKAFQMGISLTLSHLGTLPFNAEYVDPDATKH